MQADLKRTGKTALTDEELILLDVMFNCRASFRALRHDHFSEQWNYHSHHLADANLQKTLNWLCQSGILQMHTTSEETYFSFTSHGGELWELERMPVWPRYATDRYPGKGMVSVIALSEAVCRDFWEIGGEVGMWSMRNAKVKFQRIRNHILIPWKQVPEMHVAVASTEASVADTFLPVDWTAYDQRRTWWRMVTELQKFVGKPA